MSTLYCDSRGDKRFSALYAVVQFKDGHRETIEHFYQGCKRTKDCHPARKGAFVDHIVINGEALPASYLTPLYQQLWEMYFKQNPELLVYASQFDTFIDRFAGRSTNTQAKSIEKIVLRYKSYLNK